MTEKYPMDFESLQQGQYISAEQVERITGESRDSIEALKRYNFKLMGLKDEIKKALRNMGKIWEVISEDDGLRILTHKESSKYQDQKRKIGKQKIYTAHTYITAVNTSGFTEDEKKVHNRRAEMSGRTILGLSMADGRKKALSIAKTREQPKLA